MKFSNGRRLGEENVFHKNIAWKELKIVHIPQVAQSFQLLKLMLKKASSSKG